MRRTVIMAVLATLLLVTPAHAASSIQIQRDCADDGVLQGNYSVADLRKARDTLPTDASEYSDCSDVLSRAIAAKTQSDSASGGGGGATTGGGTSGGGSGGSGTTGAASGAATATPDATTMSDTSPDSDKLPAPYTPAEHAAVDQAATEASIRPVDLDGHNVVPTARLAADIGRNSVPALLIAVLALLIAGALAAASMPLLRRRGLAQRES